MSSGNYQAAVPESVSEALEEAKDRLRLALERLEDVATAKIQQAREEAQQAGGEGGETIVALREENAKLKRDLSTQQQRNSRLGDIHQGISARVDSLVQRLEQANRA